MGVTDRWYDILTPSILLLNRYVNIQTYISFKNYQKTLLVDLEIFEVLALKYRKPK